MYVVYSDNLFDSIPSISTHFHQWFYLINNCPNKYNKPSAHYKSAIQDNDKIWIDYNYDWQYK